MLLLKNIDLYTPKHIGIVDILIDKGIIKEINPNITANCHTIDCVGKIACPPFVDGHEHIIQIPEATISKVIDAGIGTIVGVLANERGTLKMDELINKTQKLRHNGINAYCLSGSKTCRYNFQKYILEYNFVVGTKYALYSDFRPNSVSYEKLKELAILTYNAAKMTNKNLQVHLHLDYGGPAKTYEDLFVQNLDWIDKIVKETNIPYSLFKLTHAQKGGKSILEYANKGVFLDYTALSNNVSGRLFDMYMPLVKAIRSNSIDISRISFSTDYAPLSKDLTLLGDPIDLLNTIRKLVYIKKLPFETVLPFITTNALAPIKKLDEFIYVGSPSNILILNEDLTINQIINLQKQTQNLIK